MYIVKTIFTMSHIEVLVVIIRSMCLFQFSKKASNISPVLCTSSTTQKKKKKFCVFLNIYKQMKPFHIPNQMPKFHCLLHSSYLFIYFLETHTHTRERESDLNKMHTINSTILCTSSTTQKKKKLCFFEHL